MTGTGSGAKCFASLCVVLPEGYRYPIGRIHIFIVIAFALILGRAFLSVSMLNGVLLDGYLRDLSGHPDLSRGAPGPSF